MSVSCAVLVAVSVLSVVVWEGACIPVATTLQLTSPSPTSVQINWRLSNPNLHTNSSTSGEPFIRLTLESLDDFLPKLKRTAILPLNTSVHTFNKLEEYTVYKATVRVVAMETLSADTAALESTDQLSSNIRTLPSEPRLVGDIRVHTDEGQLVVNWTFSNLRGQNGPIVRYTIRLNTIGGGSRQVHQVMLDGPTYPDRNVYSVSLPSNQIATVTPDTDYELVLTAHNIVGGGLRRRYQLYVPPDVNIIRDPAVLTMDDNRWRYATTGMGSLILGVLAGVSGTVLIVCLVSRSRRRNTSRHPTATSTDELYTEIQKQKMKPSSTYASISQGGSIHLNTQQCARDYEVLEIGTGDYSTGSGVYDYINESTYTYSSKQTTYNSTVDSNGITSTSNHCTDGSHGDNDNTGDGYHDNDDNRGDGSHDNVGSHGNRHEGGKCDDSSIPVECCVELEDYYKMRSTPMVELDREGCMELNHDAV